LRNYFIFSTITMRENIAKVKKAHSLIQIHQAFRNQRALNIDELGDFYQSTKEARGKNPRARISSLLKTNFDTDEHILFVGPRGCGKSTELNHLQKDIEDEFLVINFSIYDELDPSNINYIEIFIVAMEKLMSFIQQDGRIKVDEDYLKEVQDFIKATETEETKDRNQELSVEAGLGGEIKIPWLIDYFTRVKVSAKNVRNFKTVIKEKIEPRFPQLINLCNGLITQIRNQITKLGKKDIAILIEDLDKIQLSEAEDLFFNHALQVTRLKSNVIYTFPNALYYSLKFAEISTYFSEIYELPMIKVTEKDGSLYPKGYEAMGEIIAARMDLALFEDKKYLDWMIQYSGGSLRTLFLMIIEAAGNAIEDERTTINQEDWESAYDRMKKDFENTIADYSNAEGEVLISASDFYQALEDLNNNENKKVLNSQTTMLLRQSLCILTYNGKGWNDVHPIVKDILKDRK
jgi:energy-coupling factor transporter ATP-binding protein EcfA2